MTASDCVAVIGAIAAAQVAMLTALVRLYLKVRAVQATATGNAKSLEGLTAAMVANGP